MAPRVKLDMTLCPLPFQLVWFQVHSPRMYIRDVKSDIIEKFGLPYNSDFQLFLDDGLLHENESVCILRENDVIRVIFSSTDDDTCKPPSKKKCKKKHFVEETDDVSHSAAKKSHLENKGSFHTGGFSLVKDEAVVGIEQSKSRSKSSIVKKQSKIAQSSEANGNVPMDGPNIQVGRSESSEESNNLLVQPTVTVVQSKSQTKDNVLQITCGTKSLIKRSATDSDEDNVEVIHKIKDCSMKPVDCTTADHNSGTPAKRKRKRKHKKNLPQQVKPSPAMITSTPINQVLINPPYKNFQASAMPIHIRFEDSGTAVPKESLLDPLRADLFISQDKGEKQVLMACNTVESVPDMDKCGGEHTTVEEQKKNRDMVKLDDFCPARYDAQDVVHKVKTVTLATFARCSLGTCISFKLLELDEFYCPQVSKLKQGKITEIDPTTEDIVIELSEPEVKKPKTGKFENVYSSETETSVVTIDKITVNWSKLINPVLCDSLCGP